MKIEFSTCNAAFEDFPEMEIACILNKIKEDIFNQKESGVILDSNGNNIGSWEL